MKNLIGEVWMWEMMVGRHKLQLLDGKSNICNRLLMAHRSTYFALTDWIMRTAMFMFNQIARSSRAKFRQKPAQRAQVARVKQLTPITVEEKYRSSGGEWQFETVIIFKHPSSTKMIWFSRSISQCLVYAQFTAPNSVQHIRSDLF